jgi:predicted nucleic acid-binding protein
VILVDTSVWIEHFRSGKIGLDSSTLARSLLHPFVLGELSCGQLPDRRRTLRHLSELPAAFVADHGLVLRVVEHHTLWGTGLSWIDVHLLTTAIAGKHTLWTLDKGLSTAAARLNVAHHS